MADPWPGEDRLRQHRPGHQARNREADHRHHGQERIAQGVNADDAGRRQPLGARGAHVILAQDFEHRGAGHAGDDGERHGAEHDRRQDEVPQRVEESAGLIGQKRVDGHESGRLIEGIVDEVDPARDGQKPQSHGNEHDEEQAPPENRHRIAEQRHRHQRLIIEAAALDRRKRAGRNPDRDRKQHGEEREFERRREQGQKLGQNFILRRQRYAEVAMRKAPDIIEKLLPHRLVEAELMAKIRQPLRRHAVLAGPDLDRDRPARDGSPRR